MVSKRPTPTDEYATDAEVEAAVRALTAADFIRLGSIANFRALALAGLGLGQAGDDLLQEAIVRTLDGRKRWRKSVKFVTHLIQSIRNIAGHARGPLTGWNVVTATTSEPTEPRDGVIVASQADDAEWQVAAKQQFARLEKIFHDDDEVQLVADCLASGMTGPQTQQDLNISATQYDTIKKRLRRGVDRKNGWRP